MARPDDEPWLETVGGSYTFVRLLGRGGFGSVSLVRNDTLGRLEAVKVVRAGSRLLPAVRRLEREGRVLAALRHPGIVTVYRLAPIGTSAALFMEYIPGGDLQQAIDQGALTGADRVRVLGEIADALAAAAAAGVAHRDVKPSNVLMRDGRRAVLADFGLARFPRDPSVFQTMSGAVTGTPMFMAPEQVASPQDSAPAVDSYAFGVLAYQLLVGEWPYRVSSVAEVIAAHRSARPRNAGDLRPGFPAAAAAALAQALEKAPADRLTPPHVVDILRRFPESEWNDLIPPGAVGRGEHGAGAGPETASPTTGGESSSVAMSRPAPMTTGGETGTGGSRGAIAGGSVLPDTPAPALRPADQAAHSNLPDGWIKPPVYVVRRRMDRRAIRSIVGLTIGLVVGLSLFLLLMVII